MKLKINDLKDFMKEFAGYYEISDKMLSYKIGEWFGISTYIQRMIKESLEKYGVLIKKNQGVWVKPSVADCEISKYDEMVDNAGTKY